MPEPVSDCPYCRVANRGIRGQVVEPAHCPLCHTFPCDWCGGCPCTDGHDPACEHERKVQEAILRVRDASRGLAQRLADHDKKV